MYDFRGTKLHEGDSVILYYGYNELREGVIRKIEDNFAKVLITNTNTLSKWKTGECMVKNFEPA